MKIQKVSQIELVKYIDELDEKLNDKKIKDILYKQYLISNKNTRKTKTDKRYKIIAALTRDNFDTQIGDTTVWRILKIKGKSKKAFEEIKKGDRAIKETYNDLFGTKEGRVEEKPQEPKIIEKSMVDQNQESISFETEIDILNTIKKIEDNLTNNKEQYFDIKKLRDIDSELFNLRKLIMKTMQYHDSNN